LVYFKKSQYIDSTACLRPNIIIKDNSLNGHGRLREGDFHIIFAEIKKVQLF